MRRLMVRIPLALSFVLLWASCNRQPAALVQIQQQRSGDYVLTLLSDTGAVKQRANKFTLEIRNAANNELAHVTNVQIQTSMRMPGMGPMFGDISSLREITPGRYELNADFSMAGQWSFVVTFDPNGRAQFNLNAQ